MLKVKNDSRLIRKLYWECELSISEIAKRFNLNSSSILKRMRKYNIPRRTLEESSYVVYKDKPKFRIKESLTPTDEKLKIAGVMLYWAEGNKTNDIVDFANSDPEMVQLFLRFLRKICGISNERLRVFLYAYSLQDIEELKEYWSKLLDIPQKQFTKPYIRRSNKNLSNRKLPYGLVHIRYNDKRLFETILGWIDELKNIAF